MSFYLDTLHRMCMRFVDNCQQVTNHAKFPPVFFIYFLAWPVGLCHHVMPKNITNQPLSNPCYHWAWGFINHANHGSVDPIWHTPKCQQCRRHRLALVSTNGVYTISEGLIRPSALLRVVGLKAPLSGGLGVDEGLECSGNMEDGIPPRYAKHDGCQTCQTMTG